MSIFFTINEIFTVFPVTLKKLQTNNDIRITYFFREGLNTIPLLQCYYFLIIYFSRRRFWNLGILKLTFISDLK